jgi:hypothetical protein
MKTKSKLPLAALALLAGVNWVAAQGTAFTYQGRLLDGGAAATGLYDLQFNIYDAGTNGDLIGGPLTNSATAVSNGLFSVTLDFGAGVFSGSNYWLDIAARTNGGGAFAELSPRQPLTPTPYAIFAEGAKAAGLTGSIPMASLSGIFGAALDLTNAGNVFAGNGAGLINVNAVTLGGLAASSFWETAGNAGTSPTHGNFVGTTDNNPLELHVNGLRAFRLEPTTYDTNHSEIVNVLGGSPVNFVGSGIYGGTIAGGGANIYFGNPGSNSVMADFGTVGGGSGNTASGTDIYYGIDLLGYSTVCGGISNLASGSGSFVGGGGYGAGIFAGNVASGDAATVGGGIGNTASGGHYGFTTVGGGYGNSASYSYATVGGGFGNNAELNDATVGGGADNTASTEASTVAGGFHNTAGGEESFVGGGSYNTAGNSNVGFSTVGGGSENTAGGSSDGYSTVAGGSGNSASDYAAVGGGLNNNAGGESSTVCGGGYNTTSGTFATVAGGSENIAQGENSFAAGTGAEALNDNSFVWSDGGSGTAYTSDRDGQFKIQAGGGMVLDVSGSSGHNPAGLEINSTSSDGEAFYATQDSSNPTAEFANSGSGDIIKGWGGASAGTVVFEVVNDGTVYSKGVALTSDRNRKENFTPLNAQALLAQVAALSITQWNYKDDSAETRHIGPMAQDFHAAFGLNGADEKHISTVDEGGVALAAIQGLNQKLEDRIKDKEAEIQKLKEKNDSLAERLNELETTVKLIAEKK